MITAGGGGGAGMAAEEGSGRREAGHDADEASFEMCLSILTICPPRRVVEADDLAAGSVAAEI